MVGIESVDGATLTVRGIDVVDGTPLLDVKPFVAAFDAPDDVDDGWLADCRERARSERVDDRFR